MSLEEVTEGINKIVETVPEDLDEMNHIIKMSFDIAKDKIKSKSEHGDNFIERNEFRLMLVSLSDYFEYFEFFNIINTTEDDILTIEEFK